MDSETIFLQNQIQSAAEMHVCPNNNPIVFICISKNCNLNTSPFLCNTQNCSSCSFKKNQIKTQENYCCKNSLIYAQNFFKKIIKKKTNPSQKEKKSIQKIISIYDQIIDQASKERQNIRTLINNYGLSPEQSKLIQNFKNGHTSSQHIKHIDIQCIKQNIQTQSFINIQSLQFSIKNLYGNVLLNFGQMNQETKNKYIKVPKIIKNQYFYDKYDEYLIKKLKFSQIKTLNLKLDNDLQKLLATQNFQNLQKIYVPIADQYFCQTITKFAYKLPKLQTIISSISSLITDYSCVLKIPSLKKFCLAQDLQISQRQILKDYYFQNKILKTHSASQYKINLQLSQLSKFTYWQQNVCQHKVKYLQKINNVRYLSLVGIENHNFKINCSFHTKLPFASNLFALRLTNISFQSNPIYLWSSLKKLIKLQISKLFLLPCLDQCQNIDSQIFNSITSNIKLLKQFSFIIKVINITQFDLKSIQKLSNLQFLSINLQNIFPIQLKVGIMFDPPCLNKLKKLKYLKFKYYSERQIFNQMWTRSISQSKAIQQLYLISSNNEWKIDVSKIFEIPNLKTLSINSKMFSTINILSKYVFKKLNSLNVEGLISFEDLKHISNYKGIKNLGIQLQHFYPQMDLLLQKMKKLKTLKIKRSIIRSQIQLQLIQKLSSKGINVIRASNYQLNKLSNAIKNFGIFTEFKRNDMVNFYNYNYNEIDPDQFQQNDDDNYQENEDYDDYQNYEDYEDYGYYDY